MVFNMIPPPLRSKPLYYSYTVAVMVAVVCLEAVTSQMVEEFHGVQGEYNLEKST